MIKLILHGSSAFFKDIPGFVPNDTDILIWSDCLKYCESYRLVSLRGVEIFELNSTIAKEDLIELFVHSDNIIKYGIFFVPEFAQLIGLTIDDLKQIYSYVCTSFYGKYAYYNIIYDAYVENNSFTLTDEQLANVYAVYKSSRGITS